MTDFASIHSDSGLFRPAVGNNGDGADAQPIPLHVSAGDDERSRTGETLKGPHNTDDAGDDWSGPGVDLLIWNNGDGSDAPPKPDDVPPGDWGEMPTADPGMATELFA